jgi:hypothetical protein
MLMQLEMPYVFHRRRIRRTPKEIGEAACVTDVVLPCVGSQTAHQHVFLHTLAKRCRRGIVLKAGH